MKTLRPPVAITGETGWIRGPPYRDPRVPRPAKIAVIIAGLWVASPIDLIPEFVPVIGPLDDIIVVALERFGMRPGRFLAKCCWKRGPASPG